MKYVTLIAATIAVALCFLSPTRTAAQTGASALPSAAIPVVTATPAVEIPITATPWSVAGATSASDIPATMASSTEEAASSTASATETAATPTKPIIPIAVEFTENKDVPEKLFVQTWQVFSARKIPAPGVTVQLTFASDTPIIENADLQGVVVVPLILLKDKAKNSGGTDRIAIAASATYNGATTTNTFGIAAADVMARLKEVARRKYEEGKNLAKSGDYASAIDKFRETLDLFPSFSNAQFNIALCHEKMGMTLSAIREYVLYLNLDISLTDSFKAKIHIITLEESLDTSLAVPDEARRMLEDATKLVSSNEYDQALSAYDLIERRYPWWVEPYYSAGIVAEYLGYNKDFKYATWATLNFQVFLRAVNKGDPRVPEVVQKIDDLRKISLFPPDNSIPEGKMHNDATSIIDKDR